MQTETSIQPTQPLVPHEDRGLMTPKGIEPKSQIVPQAKGYDEFLLEICKKIDKECDESAEIRARRYTRNHNYWWGGERRFQYWDHNAKSFKPMDAKKVKRLFSNNQFFYQVRTILATVTRSHPRLSVSPAPSVSDNEEKVSAARVAARTIQHDQREKLSAEFMVREWMDKLLCGFAVRGQWYAKEGSTAKARVPIVEQREIPTEGMYICSECGMTGPESYAQEHEGEGHSVDIFTGEPDLVPFHAGYEEVQDGDCLTYGISPYEFDLAPEARDLPSSPYARWQRKVRKSKLKRAYKNLKLDDLSSSEIPAMLQAQEAVKRKRQEESKSDFTVLKTYWISVDEYFEFASSKPMQCLSGHEIPAGTVLSDEYPVSIRVDVSSDKIVDIRAEIKEDCLSMSSFHLDNLSWEGKGLDDAAELQRWIDDIHTLYVQIQLREALGLMTYDKELFSSGKWAGEVGSVVGVEVPQDGSGRKLADATHFIQGNQPNQSLFVGMEYVQNSQIKVAGGFDAISGAGMEGSETARGRIIQREMGLQGQGVSLFLAARHDVIWAKQNLKLKKKYWTSERYVPYLEEGEPLGGRWFSASDLNTDFIVDVEADSWMPLTRLDEIDNLTTAAGGEEALGAAGGFAGVLANPQLKSVHGLARKGLQLLGVSEGVDPEEKDLRNARHRYAILKQAVEKITEQGSMPDDKMDEEIPSELNSPFMVPPEMAMSVATLPSVRPIPDVDNHGVFASFYRDAIKDAVDSDGIENHPLTKAALILLIKAHESQGVFDLQEDNAQMVAANAPVAMAQQGMESAQADEQQAREMEKSGVAHKQGMEKQAQGSQLKQEEMKSKGEPNKGKSELSKVKV